MRLICMVVIGIGLIASSGWTDKAFKDVPEDHWAKDAVDTVSQANIMSGYPDGNFKGDRPVTRYELAVALAKMVESIQASREAVIKNSQKDACLKPSQHWAAKAQSFLICEGFLPEDSPIMKDGSTEVSCEELGDALAFVSARLIEVCVPPTGPPD